MGQQIIIPNKGTVTTQAHLPSDLIAYYRFEELDDLGTAIDWAMNFDAVVADERTTEGKVGQGLICEQGRVNFHDNQTLDEIPSSLAFTVEFWVKLEEAIKRGEHSTRTLFSKQWASGMKLFAYIVTRLETLRLHTNLSYLVADAENPSIQISGATWRSLEANGLYYKQSDILYTHALYPTEWQIVYDADEAEWYIQNWVVAEEPGDSAWVTHFKRSTDVNGAYDTTPFGSGDVTGTGVAEVNDIIDIPLTDPVSADVWRKFQVAVKFSATLPTGVAVTFGDYADDMATTQVVDIPINVAIDPQLIGGDDAPLRLATNDSKIPYILDGHPLPSSERLGISGVIDEVKVWRSLRIPVPVAEDPTLTVNIVGQGSVTKDPDKATYDYNEEVELTPVATEGFEFSHWEGDLTGDDDPATIYMNTSKIITAVFTGKVATPEFDPLPGSFYPTVDVTITCATAASTIHYTTDGETPTSGSTEYTVPITISETTTLKAIAVKADWLDSDVRSGEYVIGGDEWTRKADFGGGVRICATGFSINGKGYLGMGNDSTIYHKDLWEYNPANDTWTQKADFGGEARHFAVGLEIDGKGYIGLGWNGTKSLKDFWEYNPTNNTWTQKTDFGGTARWAPVGFSIAGKGYVGTGMTAATSGRTKDFWEYNPANNTWTQKADFGGTARNRAVGFVIGGKGYIGTGNEDSTARVIKDIWEYDPTGNTWTKKADFGGVARHDSVGFSINGKGYVGTGNEYGHTERLKDFWEYDPIANTWTQKADFGGTERRQAVGFATDTTGYIGTGNTAASAYTMDFWQYIPG